MSPWSPCGVSTCLHVDMDMECLHVSMWTWTGHEDVLYLHVFMDMEGLHVSMSPFVDMDMECLYMSPCLQVICPWSDCMFPYVSMSPCAYGYGVSPCLHMPPCLHVECLHVSMWIWTWSVFISPCGYGDGVSMFPCVSMSYVYMDMKCLHVSPCLQGDMSMECLHVSICLHVSMWIWTWNVSMCPCLHVSMWSVYMSPCGYGH